MNTKTIKKEVTEETTKKKYIIKHVPQTSLYKIFLEGGGEVHSDLNGKLFTSPTRAHQAINVFNEARGQDRQVSA